MEKCFGVFYLNWMPDKKHSLIATGVASCVESGPGIKSLPGLESKLNVRWCRCYVVRNWALAATVLIRTGPSAGHGEVIFRHWSKRLAALGRMLAVKYAPMQ